MPPVWERHLPTRQTQIRLHLRADSPFAVRYVLPRVLSNCCSIANRIFREQKGNLCQSGVAVTCLPGTRPTRISEDASLPTLRCSLLRWG